MKLTRRTFIATSAATLGAGRLWAASSITMGGMEITSLSDGNLVLPASFTFGPIPEDRARGVASMAGIDLSGNVTPPCNLTLCRHEDRLVIFDAGSGPQFMPSAGKIGDALSAIGVDPGEITHVVFTHAHPDHLWGLLDDFDEPYFYNAQHMMGRAEFDFWTDPATIDAMPDAQKSFAVGAARRLEAVADTMERFEEGAEILPGIAAVATPGHTPGHMSFELRDNTDALMVVGDAIANDHVALMHPGWEAGNDQDPALAAKTRLTLTDRLASEQMPIIGFHMSDAGLGRIERAGEGFRFVAI